MTITGLRLNLYSWCDRISFSIKSLGPFWHVKGVIFGEYFLTFTSHLSLISRSQRHRNPGPRQDTHQSCWTWSSSCTARCPPRTWTASSSTPAWRRSRISLMQIHFQKLLRMDIGYIHLSSHDNRDMNILAIENAMFPKIFFFSRSLGNFSRHGRPQKTSQTYLCPILPIL